MAYMEYMDLDISCPKKGVKLFDSLKETWKKNPVYLSSLCLLMLWYDYSRCKDMFMA